MKHDGGWKKQSSQYLFESKWYRLRQDQVELPTGEPITYTMIEHPGYAMVVPLLEDGRVLMEWVYRYTVQQTLLECPSGGLDGQAPEVAARRELEEETGWLAEHLVSLGSFYGSDGISNERCHFFLATGLSETGVVKREATEQIELELIPFVQLVERAFGGEIEDAASALALMLADRKLRAL
jgi:ADP-ribose pyrophosphatase